jgi:hypothetical protein
MVTVARAAAPLEIPVWSGVAPGSEGTHDPEKWEERGKNGVIDRAVRQVHQPTLTVYLPKKTRPPVSRSCSPRVAASNT